MSKTVRGKPIPDGDYVTQAAHMARVLYDRLSDEEMDLLRTLLGDYELDAILCRALSATLTATVDPRESAKTKPRVRWYRYRNDFGAWWRVSLCPEHATHTKKIMDGEGLVTRGHRDRPIRREFQPRPGDEPHEGGCYVCVKVPDTWSHLNVLDE